MISKKSEEYLRIMYILKKQNGNIRVTDIARKMGCTKPSVNKMINILKKENLVNYEVYGKLEFTEEGINLAKKTLEAYDVVYLFLKDVLNIDINIAKKDAENIKQIASDTTLTNLAKYTHKVLNLDSLDCCYDITKDKCMNCKKIASRIKRNIKLKGREKVERKLVKNK